MPLIHTSHRPCPSHSQAVRADVNAGASSASGKQREELANQKEALRREREETQESVLHTESRGLSSLISSQSHHPSPSNLITHEIGMRLLSHP